MSQKWLCAPKGSGFLWSRPEHQDSIEPSVISWGYQENADFGERHGWQGTRDPAAFLTVPTAIEAHSSFDLERMAALAEVPAYEWEGTSLLRVSVGPYTDEGDVRRPVTALRGLV